VFVEPPGSERHRARLRIFTPRHELPFAGHPTVGTAVLLGLIDGGNGTGHLAFGLEETVGVVPCVVVTEGPDTGYARFRLPRLPERWGEGQEPAAAAWALGLEPPQIGFDRHGPSRYSAGVDYDLVPVGSLDALAKARPNGDAFGQVFGTGGSGRAAAYVYSRDGEGRFRARMFGAGLGVAEDPATGSAAAAFAGALMEFEPLGGGEHSFVIAQGIEMGRPSEIELQIVIEAGRLASAEIGGGAVRIAEGRLLR
jgi:trans-2,3-dihydro-3-hydroxyanthranilate isomerase